MPFRPLALPTSVRGSVWLHAMPGRLEPWDVFLREAERAALSLLVCLAPRYELKTSSPQYAAAIEKNQLPMRWLHLPMRDFGLSANVDIFRAGIDQIAISLTKGDIALLHCAAGIGRTGTAAVCLLKRLGLPKDEALECVRRAGSDPQSAVQSGLVDTF